MLSFGIKKFVGFWKDKDIIVCYKKRGFVVVKMFCYRV